jgi:hypothetical protein
MAGYPFGRRVRLSLVVLLLAGWITGLVVQVGTRVTTGYMDVLPPQLALGVLLCLGAGAAARMLEPERRTARRGAIGGLAMLGSIVAGYTILTILAWNPDWGAGDGGETWFSLLIELPFWVGLPLLVGACFGALGWVAADRTGRPG